MSNRHVSLPVPLVAEDRLERSPHVERRRYQRFATNLDAEAWWQDEFGYPCAMPAVVKNASAGGFGVELGRRPPLGCLLRVRIKTNSIRCFVRHVQQMDGLFLVGVETAFEINSSAMSVRSLARLADALFEAKRAVGADRTGSVKTGGASVGKEREASRRRVDSAPPPRGVGLTRPPA